MFPCPITLGQVDHGGCIMIVKKKLGRQLLQGSTTFPPSNKNYINRPACERGYPLQRVRALIGLKENQQVGFSQFAHPQHQVIAGQHGVQYVCKKES